MKFTNLQIGRIVAASMVLAYHAAVYGERFIAAPNPLAGPWMQYLFRTTIVFLFALSGFILTHCLQTATLTDFVKYRLLRLFPAYWLAVALVVAGHAIFTQPIPYTSRAFREAMLLTPPGPKGFIYALAVEWTLVYELFLSMAIVPLAMFGRRRFLLSSVCVWLALCVGNQVIAPTIVPPWFPTKSEIFLSVVNVPFLLGVIVYFIQGRWMASPWTLVASIVTLAAGQQFLPNNNNWSYVAQAISSALAVGYLANSRQVSGNNVLVKAGDCAYGVYLLHASLLMGLLGLSKTVGLPNGSGFVVIAAGVIALAVGTTYGYLEWKGYQIIRAKLTAKRKAALATQELRRSAA